MLQRIYGTAFFDKKALDEHLAKLEEVKKRDHRRLGPALGLFAFHEVAPGSAFWLPHGTTLYNVLEDSMRRLVQKNGYQEVKTPLLFNKKLWEQSGHWGVYRENMFLVFDKEADPALPLEERLDMSLKPMNCPSHYLIYKMAKRSYRELPVRYFTVDVLHRNELSGSLAGLTRVRQFAQDDAHIFVTESQIGDEVERLLRLVQRVYDDFGLTLAMKLSTRPAEFLGEVATWDHAEAELKRAREAVDLDYTVEEGGGAFYGPKIDFDVMDALGRKWQCATIQLDYQLPQRFDLTYVGADNAEHRPVVIHRAIFGSFERFMALLLENYAGAFPLWIAPVQAAVLPIADRHAAYAAAVRDQLAAAGLRAELGDRQEKIGYKIREAQLQKVPFMLVVGDREMTDGTVSVRSRAAGDRGPATVNAFIEAALDEVRSKGRESRQQ